MRTVPISAVKRDDRGWLRIYPLHARYDLIYRAAAGVDWENKEGFLHAHEPREWTYPQYFAHIVSVVASECGDALKLTPDTQWMGVPDDIRRQIESVS